MIRAILSGTIAAMLATSAGAVIVDVSATTNAGLVSSPGVAVTLAAGSYKVTPIIGTYTAFSRFASVSGCNAGGTGCYTGFEHSYKIDIGGVVTGYGDNNGNGGLGPQSSGGYYDTTAKAFALGAAPATFTLGAAAPVKFFVYDDALGDNSGGVSLNVTAVPEPASWALMVAGFGLAGAAMRRRVRTVAA